MDKLSLFGLPNEDQVIEMPYQVQLSAHEHGRVHVFY